MIEQAKKLLAAKIENLNGNDYAEAIRMINLIQPDDTIFSWAAKCAENDLDCCLWDDLFSSMMPDDMDKLDDDEQLHFDLFKKDIDQWQK